MTSPRTKNAKQRTNYGLAGRSPALQRVRGMIRVYAPTNIAVLITGETGTGKELVARALHSAGPRGQGPFVAVNCAALPETLAESELFGHEPGAFTGANRPRAGLIQQANDGTLFLDEIGELSLANQAKLLRVLETGQLVRLGSTNAAGPTEVDVRVIAASNRSLPHEVEEGGFRGDLFYRLAGALIEIPPLRDRPEDVAVIANTHLDVAAHDGRPKGRLTRTAALALSAQPWPGNVRELLAVVEAARVASRAGVITRRTIWAELVARAGADAPVEPVRRTTDDRVLEVLRTHGVCSPSELRALLSKSASTVYRSLRRLEQSGLVHSVGSGTAKRYATAHEAQVPGTPNGLTGSPSVGAAVPVSTSENLGASGWREVFRPEQRITRARYADGMRVSKRTASRHIAALVTEGLLVPDGRGGKHAGYVVASEPPTPRSNPVRTTNARSCSSSDPSCSNGRKARSVSCRSDRG